MNFKVKNDFFVVLQGEEYTFVDCESHLLLVSKDPHHLANGFEAYKEKKYIRQVQVTELDTAYHCTTHARYKDIICSVTSYENGQIELYYVLDYEKAIAHDFTHVDRNEYVKKVSLSEVESIWYRYDPMFNFEIPDEQRIQMIEW